MITILDTIAVGIAYRYWYSPGGLSDPYGPFPIGDAKVANNSTNPNKAPPDSLLHVRLALFFYHPPTICHVPYFIGRVSRVKSAAFPEHKARQIIPPIQTRAVFTGIRTKKDPRH